MTDKHIVALRARDEAVWRNEWDTPFNHWMRAQRLTYLADGQRVSWRYERVEGERYTMELVEG